MYMHSPLVDELYNLYGYSIKECMHFRLQLVSAFGRKDLGKYATDLHLNAFNT